MAESLENGKPSSSATKLIQKTFKTPPIGRFSKEVFDHEQRLDNRTAAIEEQIIQRRKVAPKTYQEKFIRDKHCIEKQLEQSDLKLSEVIQFGNELVTNVKVANEKREITRRNFEALKREDLLSDLEKESIQAMAKFDEITSQWFELDEIKEPMGLYEELKTQKQRIQDLMQQKDEIIKKCQAEVQRVDQRYYDDQEKQATDLYSIVGRIENQIDLIKTAYDKHLELLESTIDDEKQNVSISATRKWQELYDRQQLNEITKSKFLSEKTKFFTAEIERVTREQEEQTRATRIRLERDAEQLQLELTTMKMKVLMNTEKFDYNFQILQRRNEENCVIGSQQKRRLGKINENIMSLKKKIKDNETSSEAIVKRLTSEVIDLHKSITALELKSEQIKKNNEKKYSSVFELNYAEAMEILLKLLEIDRILYEQQLGLEWRQPELPIKPTVTPPKPKQKKLQHAEEISGDKLKVSVSSSSKLNAQKVVEKRLLRNILRRISDSSGFLIEEKLLALLEPYAEENKALVRIDNIFEALKISTIDDVESLTDNFLPYTWCPNCQDGISAKELGKLLDSEENINVDKSEGTQGGLISTATMFEMNPKSVDIELMSIMSFDPTETITDITNMIGSTQTGFDCTKTDGNKFTKKFECTNHYLVIEPCFVLTALREFVEKRIDNPCDPEDTTINIKSEMDKSQLRSNKHSAANTSKLIKDYWVKFLNIMPEEKQKLWHAIKHALTHYLLVLRERESLDEECEFLRKQNTELKYLLQKYLK